MLGFCARNKITYFIEKITSISNKTANEIIITVVFVIRWASVQSFLNSHISPIKGSFFFVFLFVDELNMMIIGFAVCHHLYCISHFT